MTSSLVHVLVEHGIKQQKYRWKMGSLIVEIRAGEGGEDAKSLVVEQFALYSKMGVRRCL